VWWDTINGVKVGVLHWLPDGAGAAVAVVVAVDADGRPALKAEPYLIDLRYLAVAES
jgi:hypothetical protein